MTPRNCARTFRLIPGLFVGLAVLLCPMQAMGQGTTWAVDAGLVEHAREILGRHPVFDGHNDLPWEIRMQDGTPMDVDAYDLRTHAPGQTDLARLEQGGVGAQFWSVYVPGEYADSGFARIQLEEIDIALRMIEKYPELELALSVGDVERAMKQGRIASLLGAEGGHAIENSLGALRAYYALGVRYMTLTHNVTLDWADAAQDEARNGGLTSFGEQVVREMNRLGMLVDLSHVSPATMSDVLNVSEAPVIFSHSSARALTDVPRNVPDSILSRMRANGGVVMVTFVPSFVSQELADWVEGLTPLRDSLVASGATQEQMREVWAEYQREHVPPVVTLADVADHVEHVKNFAGLDHVGIGGYYDGMGNPPAGLSDVSTYPNLFAELLRRGWSDEDLGKLASGNILRAFREAEAVSRRIQADTTPSAATPVPTS
jgi:membrane dipeptidase